MEKKKQLAIALCRVSSDEQLKNNSLNRQSQAVQRIAEEYGLDIIRTWSGSVSSKRGNNIKRKDLQEMLDFCKANKRVKYLIVDEPDRFMRSMQEAAYFEVIFGQLGVKLLYSDPQLNEDTSIARFQKLIGYYGAEVSNEERQRKSIKGCEAAIKEGRYPFPYQTRLQKRTSRWSRHHRSGNRPTTPKPANQNSKIAIIAHCSTKRFQSYLRAIRNQKTAAQNG